MEELIFKSVLAICVLILLVYVLKFIQTIWLKQIEIKERKSCEDGMNAEQEKIFDRKIKLIEKQEMIRNCERLHELEMKKIK
jgi:hypothetical protein